MLVGLVVVVDKLLMVVRVLIVEIVWFLNGIWFCVLVVLSVVKL